MFSNKTQLLKRTPENGTDRESFLSLLVDEYLHSSSYGKSLGFSLINIVSQNQIYVLPKNVLFLLLIVQFPVVVALMVVCLHDSRNNFHDVFFLQMPNAKF